MKMVEFAVKEILGDLT
jgi:hypothetical protein